MAEAAGKTVTPHMSSGGLGWLYMLNFTGVVPNADRFHEFKMFATRDANGTLIPYESKKEPFRSIDGKIKVPEGSGLGISVDPDYIKTHEVLIN
jgi:L-alanine-DL-glutamate epimerase-like enolase superfamily enzyme